MLLLLSVVFRSKRHDPLVGEVTPNPLHVVILDMTTLFLFAFPSSIDWIVFYKWRFENTKGVYLEVPHHLRLL